MRKQMELGNSSQRNDRMMKETIDCPPETMLNPKTIQARARRIPHKQHHHHSRPQSVKYMIQVTSTNDRKTKYLEEEPRIEMELPTATKIRVTAYSTQYNAPITITQNREVEETREEMQMELRNSEQCERDECDRTGPKGTTTETATTAATKSKRRQKIVRRLSRFLGKMRLIKKVESAPLASTSATAFETTAVSYHNREITTNGNVPDGDTTHQKTLDSDSDGNSDGNGNGEEDSTKSTTATITYHNRETSTTGNASNGDATQHSLDKEDISKSKTTPIETKHKYKAMLRDVSTKENASNGNVTHKNGKEDNISKSATTPIDTKHKYKQLLAASAIGKKVDGKEEDKAKTSSLLLNAPNLIDALTLSEELSASYSTMDETYTESALGKEPKEVPQAHEMTKIKADAAKAAALLVTIREDLLASKGVVDGAKAAALLEIFRKEISASKVLMADVSCIPHACKALFEEDDSDSEFWEGKF